jgi:Carboxypeptidase regulatory-like domain
MSRTNKGLAALSVFLSALFAPALDNAGPINGAISGSATLRGTPPKTKPFDLSKQSECVKMHASDPLFPESVLVGPGNSLRNVLVYISAGAPDANSSVPVERALFDQQGCHYTTHVLPLRVGQEVAISNNDPFPHNIHPMARLNREWNKLQPPNTPPFYYSYDQPEFIPVKCNIHSWMQGYFVVLKTRYAAVTGGDGRFTLPNLPPGRYSVTAWHEVYGTQTQEVTIGSNETQTINFNFTSKP